MIFLKLIIAVLIFALPLGVLCGFAARQANLGRVSRFPEYKFPGRKIILQIAAVVCIAVAVAFHRGTFNIVVMGLIAMLIVETALIACGTYFALLRFGRSQSKFADQVAVITETSPSKSEKAGIKLAAWIHDHPVAARALVWSIVAAIMVMFVNMLLDIASKGSWVKAAITFTVVGLGAWRATKKAKASND